MASRVTVPNAGDLRFGRWLGAPSLPLPVGGEERLARLAGEGSERAFAALYERYHQPLYRYCRSLVRSDVDAQDALQSTFAAALGALRRGQRDAPLRPWLFRIAHNESISLLRRRRADAELSEATESRVPSAEHSAEDRARLASLVADLSDLPERQRGALVMRELSGLSHEQIAKAFGMSVGAAKQTVFEARRSLAEFAEGRSMACEEIQRVISDGDGRARRARRVRAHLRDCSRCAAFATAISGREADLRALSPALPIAAASGILIRLTGAGSGHGGGAGGLAAGATGKAATTVLSLKAAAAGVAVISAAAAGTVGVLHTDPASQAQASAGHRAGVTHPQPSPATPQSGASAPASHGAGEQRQMRRLGAHGGTAASAAGAQSSGKQAGHAGNAALGNGSSRPGSSGLARGSGLAPGSASRGSAGNSTHSGGRAGSGTHPGTSGHAGPTSHPGNTSHPTSTSHRGSTSHPGSTTHPASGGHPTSTSHPGSGSQPSHSVTTPASAGSPPTRSGHTQTAPSTATAGQGSPAGTGHSTPSASTTTPDPTSAPSTNATGDSQGRVSASTVTTPVPVH